MDGQQLTDFLTALFGSVALISVFLLIGTLLRAKFKIFQKLFLPASVIGGFLGLLLGPIVLKNYAVLPIPQDWLQIFSLLPGYLIVPVVASVPLGIYFGSKNKGKKGQSPLFPMFLVLSIVALSQTVFGLLVANVFRKSSELYHTFGTELSAGFSGGHGTAGVIGGLLRSAGQPYWETAQGLATTSATVGLVGGILIGIVLINIASRKGYTTYFRGTESLSSDMITGVQKDTTLQENSGKETTHSSSIDSLGFHVALIMTVSGLAFFLSFLLKKYNVTLLNLIPEWAYAILLMYGVWGLMKKIKIDWIVDPKTKSKIASSLTEFAVVAAIMSLPIEAVFNYILPLAVLMVGGLVMTFLLSYFLSKWFLKDYWFERSVAIGGTNTGVFLTGLLLLKMVDPKLETPVLKDYSIAYSFNSIVGFVLIPLNLNLLVAGKYWLATGIMAAVVAVYFAVLLFTGRKKVKADA